MNETTKNLQDELKETFAAGVSLGDVTVWSTPRRLALIARGLPDATEAVREEVKGPKVGAPPQAETLSAASAMTESRESMAGNSPLS